MSNLEALSEEVRCGAGVAGGPVWEVLDPREVALGGTRAMGGAAQLEPDAMRVSRTLPNRDRRMVGAWCFVDHFNGDAMSIPPHPHTGLQTVTWLVDGEVHHRDSVGSAQLIAPGQLNLMTAGVGIAHSEVSTAGPMHGVQLWVALPRHSRRVDPHFEHHPMLPTIVDGPVTVTVLMGDLAGIASPARTYTPLVGAEFRLGGGAITVALDPDYEYAVLALSGSAEIEHRSLPPGPLLYLGHGRHDLHLAGDARVLLLGGVPFDEEIVMWWNFIGRSHEDIVADREDWMAGRRFGPVIGFDGEPLPAPNMPATPLKPRGRTRNPFA